MTFLKWIAPAWMFAEIGPESFHARLEQRGVDLPVSRRADGRLSAVSVKQIQAAVQSLAGGRSGWGRVRVCCALAGRGLILRTIALPAAAGEIARLLPLQMEAEFPLPPEALAWGWTSLSAPGSQSVDEPRRLALVAAVRREVVEEHAELFTPWAAEVVFTPAALARAELIPNRPSRFTLLDVGRRQCELLLWQTGSAPVIRSIALGSDSDAGSGESLKDASGSASLLSMLEPHLRPGPASTEPTRLWISGPGDSVASVAEVFSALEPGIRPQILTVQGGAGATAAIEGLTRRGVSAAFSGPADFIALRTPPPVDASSRFSARIPRRPLAVVAALLALALVFPYLEAWVLKPRLARRLAQLKAGDAQLAVIDRELSFLRYLELNQTPHLDATFVIAQAAPPGTRVDALSISRQGEVSLTGHLRDLAQVGDFRLRLVNSGFFSTVVVEDQTPTQDRQRINFRISARWKDSSEREGLTIGPNLPPTGSNTPAASAGPGLPPTSTGGSTP